MKEKYERPAMLTEKVDIGALVASVGSPLPTPDLAVFGACTPCEPG